MDRIDQGVLVYCPLLDQPASYVPDVVDLTQDTEARYIWNWYNDDDVIHESSCFSRQYWLECFEESLDKFVSQAIKSQPHSDDAPARAQKFKEKYISRLQYLKQHPWYSNFVKKFEQLLCENVVSFSFGKSEYAALLGIWLSGVCWICANIAWMKSIFLIHTYRWLNIHYII